MKITNKHGLYFVCVQDVNFLFVYVCKQETRERTDNVRLCSTLITSNTHAIALYTLSLPAQYHSSMPDYAGTSLPVRALAGYAQNLV